MERSSEMQKSLWKAKGWVAVGLALGMSGTSPSGSSGSVPIESAHTKQATKRYVAAVQNLRHQPRSGKARHQLDVAEKIMARAYPGPPMSGKIPHFRPSSPPEADWVEEGRGSSWENAKAVLTASLALEPSGRGYGDLGMFYFRSGNYQEAIGPLTRALKVSPSSGSLRESLQQAREVPRIEAWAERLLPKRQQITTVTPFPVKGRHLWTVLSSEPSGIYRENALISVLEERHNRLSLLWRSPVIASIDHREYHSTDLWVFPMTGRRTPELVFMGVCSGGSANPTRLQIYHWTGRIFRQTLSTESEEQALWIDDLHHTGRYQVRCVHLVGKEMGHGGQIRWVDVYDWNGKRYVETNANYPEAFRHRNASQFCTDRQDTSRGEDGVPPVEKQGHVDVFGNARIPDKSQEHSRIQDKTIGALHEWVGYRKAPKIGRQHISRTAA